MEHDLFGYLRFDDGDRLWTGTVTLRSFAAFGKMVSGDEAELRQRRDGILPLTINDPPGTGPSPQQEAAFRHLRDHEPEVFRAALDTLFDSYKAYTDPPSPLSGLWDRIGRWLGVKPIEAPAELASQAYFMSVEIPREHRNGLAYVIFNVHCFWESEHGMMVIYHKDRPGEWTTPDALELISDVHA